MSCRPVRRRREGREGERGRGTTRGGSRRAQETASRRRLETCRLISPLTPPPAPLSRRQPGHHPRVRQAQGNLCGGGYSRLRPRRLVCRRRAVAKQRRWRGGERRPVLPKQLRPAAWRRRRRGGAGGLAGECSGKVLAALLAGRRGQGAKVRGCDGAGRVPDRCRTGALRAARVWLGERRLKCAGRPCAQASSEEESRRVGQAKDQTAAFVAAIRSYDWEAAKRLARSQQA